MVCCARVWYGVVCYCVVWYRMVWYDNIACRVWRDISWCNRAHHPTYFVNELLLVSLSFLFISFPSRECFMGWMLSDLHRGGSLAVG